MLYYFVEDVGSRLLGLRTSTEAGVNKKASQLLDRLLVGSTLQKSNFLADYEAIIDAKNELTYNGTLIR